MENRALIALVLSLAVLLFWQYYFGLFQPTEAPKQDPSQVAAPTTTQPPTMPGAPPQVPSPAGLPKDRVAPVGKQSESWTVEGPLYKMGLTAPGARLNSFELRKYRKEVSLEAPPMEMVPAQAGGYLPIAVDLLHHQDWELSTRPFTGDSPAKIKFATSDPPRTLTLNTEVPNQVRVSKLLTFSPETYVIDLELQLQNLSGEKLVDQLGMSFYFQPYADDPQKDVSYNPSQLTFYEKNSLTNLPIKDLVKETKPLKAPMDWVAYENNFFINAVIPLSEGGYQIVPRVLDEKAGLLQLVYLTDTFEVDPNGSKSFKLRLYIGPKDINQLDKAEHNLDKAVDYGWFTIIAKPLLSLLNWFYGFTRNYGVAIILMTILVKILFWPLSHKSYQSMQKMKKIQPKIAQLREKYKDDREAMNKEMMNLYRTYKVNPLGGCLPMLLQIPVFFALYRMLNAAVELRHEPFMLWIDDLTAPDRLNIGFDIPYLGGLPVLTLLMGITSFIQQKMTPTGGDPRQEKIMLFMPIMFTVIFVNFASGLVLYWLVNNILSIGQQYWTNRHAS